MKNILKTLVLSLVVVAMSCSDYLDVNQSPNSPSADDVTPELILAGAMTNSFRPLARRMNRLGNVMMNNWGANVNSFTGGFAEEFSLALDNNFYSDVWSGLYLPTSNFQAIINFESTQYDNHKAIAKIMKAFYFQYLVDLYGDIPYSQAHLGIENLTPAYDDDAVIYQQLYTELEEAIELINNAPAGTARVGNEDVIYNGAMGNWVAFANTLKLRLLVRQSTKAQTDATLAAYVDGKFAELDGSAFITADATINPGYSNASTAQQNPFYNYIGFSNNETTATGYNFYRASKYAVDFLSGQLPGSIPDPRITRIYAEDDNGGGQIVGHEQGADGQNSAPGLSPIGPGLLIDSAQDGIIMLAAESYLLQAEAQLNGKISGDAGTSFQNAITASFAFYGLATTGYAPTNPGLGWTGSDNDKLQAIMRQKWIALNGINGIESWIEFTRTGYPAGIPLALTAQSTTRPKRLMYPSTEYVSNSANVPAQVSADAFATGPFWAQ